ncbi:FixH family protein [Salinimicrobium sp. GXAS 041]|uniref:FixH family protein n=1 Tax=Salinimicrobium sp. GXAS 041 TaxID=3400806 RepID=UPI003C73FE01
MKILKYISLFLVAAVTACSSDSDEILLVNETEGLLKIQTLQNEHHELELYSENGKLQTGYNKIVLRLKDKEDEAYISNAEINWMPMMQMESMQHSAPKSEVVRLPETETLYAGYVVFQMAENESEFWSLEINYSIGGQSFTMQDDIVVSASNRRKVAVFTGSDDIKYVMALVEPREPQVATNNISIALFKMEDMHSFSIVDHYRILIDPRMPGMGNHSSPNNVHLTQNMEDGFYYGDLNLTMSGYWKINLQLENAAGEIVKGEAIEGTTESSSIFLELEF